MILQKYLRLTITALFAAAFLFPINAVPANAAVAPASMIGVKKTDNLYYGKMGTNDPWTSLGSPYPVHDGVNDKIDKLSTGGNRILVMGDKFQNGGHTLYGRDLTSGWRTIATGITGFEMSESRIVIWQEDPMGGSIIRAKSGLDDGWTTLASQAFINPNAGAVKVSGNRIAYYVTGGPINVRDSLSGPWTSYPIAAGSGWTWDISPQLVVVRLNSTTILGRTTLSGGWTTLANNFSNIGPLKVSGDRIATIADGVIPGTNTTTGVLKAKDGINGAWFNLEYGVTDFDISTQNVVALGKYGNSSLVQAKKGLNDPWSNLGRYGYNPIYSYGSRAGVWQGITSGIPNLDNVLMWDPVTGQRILVADRVYQGFWSIGPNQ